jgi:hypothetical protein
MIELRENLSDDNHFPFHMAPVGPKNKRRDCRFIVLKRESIL